MRSLVGGQPRALGGGRWTVATCETHDSYGLRDWDVTLPAWFSLASKGAVMVLSAAHGIEVSGLA
jgi:hypothetical protein